MNPRNSPFKASKMNAALEAVKHVEDEFVVGLGSGSTAAYAIEILGQRVRKEGLRILAVPTSYQAFLLAAKHGIALTTLAENPKINVTIDGADQIDQNLNLIKGLGGALAREKIVASASKQNIIVADESKRVDVLGENSHPLPVEVLPFAHSTAKLRIEAIGGVPIIREGKRKVGPVITDNGNMILDVSFGLISQPAELEEKIKMIPGVVETGLFVDLADIAYVGTNLSVERMERKLARI